MMRSACCLMVLALVGCSSGDKDYSVAPVKGTVMVGDKPLTEGTITFFPQTTDAKAKESGKKGWGKIEPDGTFQLNTYGKLDGAVIGKHKITISLPAPETATFDPKYMTPDTSPLEFEVKAGENKADFKLDPKKK
jgi:hypothetical protein